MKKRNYVSLIKILLLRLIFFHKLLWIKLNFKILGSKKSLVINYIIKIFSEFQYNERNKKRSTIKNWQLFLLENNIAFNETSNIFSCIKHPSVIWVNGSCNDLDYSYMTKEILGKDIIYGKKLYSSVGNIVIFNKSIFNIDKTFHLYICTKDVKMKYLVFSSDNTKAMSEDELLDYISDFKFVVKFDNRFNTLKIEANRYNREQFINF